MGTMLRAAALSAAMLFSAAALAQDGADPARPDPDLFLGEEALTELFAGASLEGCYVENRDWAETTAADGALFDDLLGGVEVGDWWVEDSAICYRYTGEYDHPPGIYCWNVIQQESELYFFNPEDGAMIASTNCSQLIS